MAEERGTLGKKPGASMQKFAAAHLPLEGEGVTVDKADRSLTVYLSSNELARVEEMKTRLGLSRQDVMRQCIVSGLEQFNAIAKWWK